MSSTKVLAPDPRRSREEESETCGGMIIEDKEQDSLQKVDIDKKDHQPLPVQLIRPVVRGGKTLRKTSYSNSSHRQVRFATVKTKVLDEVSPASQMTKEEKNTIWWSQSEYYEFEHCNGRLCATMTAGRPTNKNRVDETSATLDRSSYHALLNRVYGSCLKATTENLSEVITNSDRDELAKWARNSHFRRGLEGRFLKEDAAGPREMVAHTVLLLHKNADILNTDAKNESIRTLCERLSRPSRLFAQALAQADAECVKPKPERCRIRSLLLVS
jgi:hypothetical protein